MTAQEPQDARRGTITITYGGQSRTVEFEPSEDAWSRLDDSGAIAAEVRAVVFDMLSKESSADLPLTLDSGDTTP